MPFKPNYCLLCGPVKEGNFLLPSVERSEFLLLFPHLKKQFDYVEGIERKRHFLSSVCHECVTTMEVVYVNEFEAEDFPLLINKQFYSSRVKDYVDDVLKTGVKIISLSSPAG
jgi:hypothetical protein